MVLKGSFIQIIEPFFTYFYGKITLKELFLCDSQFWKIADFVLIGI
jgi:hypothetical protein